MTVDERKQVVLDFLARCRAWGAEREIPKLMGRLAADPTPADAAKLHQWTTWVQFVDHATGEVADGQLDDWFRPSGGPGYHDGSEGTP